MIWIVLGVLLWSAIHFVPTIGGSLKTRLIETWGEIGYKAGFAVVVLLSVILIVVGWRSTEPAAIYWPPSWAGPVTGLLMVVAFLLLGATGRKTRIRHFVRHPQLMGVLVWSIAHLLSNGDSRSVILFGGFALWALIEMPLISAREGTWIKPELPSVAVEIRGIVISLIVLAAVFALHPYFTGVSPVMH